MIISTVDKNKIGNGGKSVLGCSVLDPCLHSHQCRRQVWSNHLTFCGPAEPAAVIVMQRQQTCTQKGTLPYILIFSPCGNPINADPVLMVSASGVIGENLLSVISVDWKPICVQLHVWPHMSMCMCIWGKKNIPLELTTGNIHKEPSFHHLGRRNPFLLLGSSTCF